MLSPHELRESEYRSGWAPITKKVTLHHFHQKREEIIFRRASDVWGQIERDISIVLNDSSYTVQIRDLIFSLQQQV